VLTQLAIESLQQQLEGLLIEEGQTLQTLREHAAVLRHSLERIHSRPATSVSLVATDGGNNAVKFDPLLVDLVRIVDSSSNEYHLEAVTPNLSTAEIDARQFDGQGRARTALGRMMRYLNKNSVADLCPVFDVKETEQRSASWVQEYRGLHEWAVLFHLVREKDFGTDTIIVRDGPFREKMFKPGLFSRFREGLKEGIEHQRRSNRRQIFLVGIMKTSKIFQKYRLALALENTFHTRYPCFGRVPLEMLRSAYKWKEWIENLGTKEDFVGGELFATKFGSGLYDPVWMVDIFESQAAEAARIMGYLLNDAIGGFPIPCYPASLQRAHDAAALVEFDMDILQHLVQKTLRASLGDRGHVLDKLALQEIDPAGARYGG
jgi:hypothetical protein